jgi:uncharacterized protein YukE
LQIIKTHFRLHRDTVLRETSQWVGQATAAYQQQFQDAYADLESLLNAL